MPENNFAAWEIKTFVGSFFSLVILSSVLVQSGILVDTIGEPPTIGTEEDTLVQEIGVDETVNEQTVVLDSLDPVKVTINGTQTEPPDSVNGTQVEVVESNETTATLRYTYQEPLISLDPEPPTFDDGDGAFGNRENTDRLNAPTGQLTTIGYTSSGQIYLNPQGSSPTVELSGLGSISESDSAEVSQGQTTELSISPSGENQWVVEVTPTTVQEVQFSDGDTGWVVEGQYTIVDPETDSGITGTIRQVADTILFIGEIFLWSIGYVIYVVAQVLLAVVEIIAFVGQLSFYLISGWLNVGALIPGVLGLLFQGFTLTLFMLLFNGIAKTLRMIRG